MTELTLEALAKRVDAIEKTLAELDAPKKDWRWSVGMFAGNEFVKQVDSEGAAIREADRQAARADDCGPDFVASGAP
ncbi:MAG: hypothetical protein K2P78_04615 [Gemmataceae bacterium]|nr:hypothetical protein [Gemmataceae bacterium]